MKIKKYISKTIKLGKEQVYEELGENAVILSSRTLSGENGQNLIEIVAATEEQDSLEEKKLTRPLKDKLSMRTRTENEIDSGFETKDFLVKDYPTKGKRVDTMIFDRGGTGKTIDFGKMDGLIEKINSISKQNDFGKILPSDLSPIYDRLTFMGYGNILVAKTIINSLSEIVGKSQREVFEITMKNLLKSIGAILHKNERKSSLNGTSIFIGSGGSGKTLTAVKLALLQKMAFKNKSLLVSADNMKVGGSEQLRTYSTVSSIDFHNLEPVNGFKDIVEKRKDYDCVLIDTPGIPLNDKQDSLELDKLIESTKPERVFVVLSATETIKTHIKQIERYKGYIKPKAIISKVDEEENIGGLLELLAEKKIPLEYLSHGLEIPEDISHADLDTLIDFSFDSNTYLNKVRI
ncbi:MAG: flagellar biosynthesis protein FlhF [Candidatus Kapaibacteriales bacterium]